MAMDIQRHVTPTKKAKPQPSWVDDETWTAIKEVRDGNPNLFRQQVDARAEQSSSSTLHLRAVTWIPSRETDILAEFYRRPTFLEKEYASSHGVGHLQSKILWKANFVEMSMFTRGSRISVGEVAEV